MLKRLNQLVCLAHAVYPLAQWRLQLSWSKELIPADLSQVPSICDLGDWRSPAARAVLVAL